MALPPELSDISDALFQADGADVPGAIRTLYSLLFLEVLQAKEGLWRAIPAELYLNNFGGGQEKLGPIMIAAWREWCGLGLGDAFPHEYVSAGASESLQHLILPGVRVNVVEGEYEGYVWIASNRKIPYRVHKTFAAATEAEYDENDLFFVSDPSAIDGDYVEGLENWLRQMHDRHPRARIVVDVTYVGLVKDVRPRDFAMHPNVRTVVFSMSKPFGIYYDRIGGCVSRDEVKTLEANKWFCNVFSIAFATMLMRRHKVDLLPKRYEQRQRQALNQAIADGLVPPGTRPANAILLAVGPTGPDEFRRTDGKYRFCLTPGMYRELYPNSPKKELR